MEAHTNICQTCLSNDRQLVSTSRIRSVLKQIKCVELENKSICWECHSIMMKYYKFKLQARHAQIVLTNKLQKLHTLSTLYQTTKNSYDFELKYNYDPLMNNTVPVIDEKYELNIKQELENTEDLSAHDFIDSDDDIKLQVFVDNIKKYKQETKPTKRSESQDKKKIKVDTPLLKEKVVLWQEEALRSQEQKKTKLSQHKNKITEFDPVVLKEKFTTVLLPEEALRSQELKKTKLSQHKNKTTDVDPVVLKEKFTTVLLPEEALRSQEQKKTKLSQHKNKTTDVDLVVLKEKFTTVLLPEEALRSQEQKKTKLSQHKNKTTDVELVVLKEKFKTVLLTEEEMLRSREKKRSHYNYKKTPYKCDTCVLGFTKKENFDVHFKKKHDKDIGAYTCEVCCTRFATQPSLDHHRSMHFIVYACSLCEYKISAVKAAINHCRDKHALDDKDRIHCKQCDAMFRTPEKLAEHTRTEHTLYCKDCGEKFKGQHTLRAHRVRIHAVKRDFICDICTKTFVTRSRMESHMIKHGQTVARRLAYCATCRVQYKNIHVYRSHVRNSVNHSQNRYQCPECNKKFASKVYWTKHYNFYHLKQSQYKCESCNKMFISKWRLKNHRQKHHGLSRSRDHACNECGKKFYTPSTLRGHMLTHSEKRTYMCSECGDSFKQRPALYTHERRVHRVGSGSKSGG